jgi:FixJ family two-component response regulator
MPGASGLDLEQHLGSNGNTRPIIFLTGYGDIAMTVQAMKADILQRTADRLIKQHVDRYATLTPRERAVLREVAMRAQDHE